MALRLSSGPTLSTRSAQVGQTVEVAMKVENTGAAPEDVSLFTEGVTEGALAKPVEFPFVFEPASQAVKAKGRASLTFSWKAALPDDKEAFTYRGKVVLRRTTDGKLIGEAPLEVYVRRE